MDVRKDPDWVTSVRLWKRRDIVLDEGSCHTAAVFPSGSYIFSIFIYLFVYHISSPKQASTACLHVSSWSVKRDGH